MANLWHAQGSGSDQVTVSQNTAGVMTEIFSIDADDGTLIRLLNRVSMGSKRGLPHYADLKDGANADLPINSKLEWRFRPAGEETFQRVSERVDTIGPFNQLSLSEQRDEDFIDAVKIDLQAPPGSETQGSVPGLRVRDIDEMALFLESSAQIDWTNASLYLEPEATDTLSRSQSG